MENNDSSTSQKLPSPKQRNAEPNLTKTLTNEKFLERFHLDSSSSLLSFKTDDFFLNHVLKKFSNEFASLTPHQLSLRSLIQLYHSFIQKYGISHLSWALHKNGENDALVIHKSFDSLKDGTFDLILFNKLFLKYKKSKSPQYKIHNDDLDLFSINGFYLAQSLKVGAFRWFCIISRSEFLEFSQQEKALFHMLNSFFNLYVEKIFELEFSELKHSSSIKALEHFPLGLELYENDKIIFNNNYDFKNAEKVKLLDQAVNNKFRLEITNPNSQELSSLDFVENSRIQIISDLFNTLRHELSNPLFGLSLSTEFLKCEWENGSDEVLMVHEMNKTIKRAQKIIDNMTNLFNPQNTDSVCLFQKIFYESLTLAKSELKGTKITLLGFESKDHDIEVCINPTALFQIIFNILLNSAQAFKLSSILKPELTFILSKSSQELKLEIIDNGPGIDEKSKNSLFKPFNSSKKSGHGLGLTLSKSLALKFGGNISYDQDFKHGCRFVLDLKCKN